MSSVYLFGMLFVFALGGYILYLFQHRHEDKQENMILSN